MAILRHKYIRMKNLNLIFIGLVINLLITSCEKDNKCNIDDCDQQVLISNNQYHNAPNDQLEINSIELIDDCLKISFSSGGCSGDTWIVKLIDSENIMESAPPQRNMRLSLDNNEPCDAYISKEITFNIKSLQVDGGEVFLNIVNSEDQILYEY